MLPNGNDIIMDFSRSPQGTAWLKVLSPAEIDKAFYWCQAGQPAGAESFQWEEGTGIHYLTMWWPVNGQNGETNA